ncbi:MAG: histidinol dehydrogenase [Bacteroidales bacterium]
MNIIKYPEKAKWKSLLARPSIDVESLISSVSEIIDEVKKGGDKALYELTRKFDKVELDSIAVSSVELAAAKFEIDDQLKASIDLAKSNIEFFHNKQVPGRISCETNPGVRVWQEAKPIEKVGLYIPGGTAPLLSTVLMLGIPAKIAGCSEVVLCTPPSKEGKVDSAILYTASLLGINKIFKLGGAQAIAAMAYGTESVPAVYKIFGPGNQYVTAAKLKVSLDNIAIDMPAGPSEVAVIADNSSNPAYVASDLLSQAEHGIDSQVLLVTKDSEIIEKIQFELDKQLSDLPRKEMAKKSLDNSRFILLKTDEEILDLINTYAPEHLIIVTENYSELVKEVRNAGSVFLGPYTPESAGDYASGTNHTLPTNGTARAYSGVNIDSFMKKITYQEITRYGLFNLGPAIERMAKAEDLEAHSRAVSIRMNAANNYRS